MWCSWKVLVLVGVVVRAESARGVYQPRSDTGYPAGLVPECPGVTKNATIKSESQPLLQIVLHSVSDKGQVHRRSLPLATAHKAISKNNYLDWSKKTVVYACGFFDSSVFPHSQAMASSYARRGYNVLVTETFNFYTYIYPKSARLTRVIGRRIGELLVRLVEQGLEPARLELVGISLGAHTVAFAAKHLRAATGSRPARLTGLDPAGPCFRALPPEDKLGPEDAQHVDVLHTNIDGFGIAERLGHVDYYANGGEYQPSDIPYIPCLVVCSHLRAVLYWWMALEHPRQFIGVQCESIQDARLARCYDSPVHNYVGLETNFSRPGVFYLPTNNEFPYYRGRDALNARNEIYRDVAADINSDDNFEA